MPLIQPGSSPNFIVKGILALLAVGVATIIVTTLTVTNLALSAYMDLTETAAPSVGAVATSRVYADSTTHGLKVSRDAGAFGKVLAEYAAGSIAANAGNKRSVATNVATMTSFSLHGFSVGQPVTVANCGDATYNGTRLITAVPSTTTFSFALVHADEALTADAAVTYAVDNCVSIGGVIHYAQDAAPTGAVADSIWHETDTGQLKEFDGTAWNPLTIQSSPVQVNCVITPPTSIGQGTTALAAVANHTHPYGRYTDSNTTGDNFTYTVTLPKGTYRLDVSSYSAANTAIMEVDVDGVDLGDTDTYAAAVTPLIVTPSTTLALAGGVHTVKFVANGKNALSTDYYLWVGAFQFTRTGD